MFFLESGISRLFAMPEVGSGDHTCDPEAGEQRLFGPTHWTPIAAMLAHAHAQELHASSNPEICRRSFSS